MLKHTSMRSCQGSTCFVCCIGAFLQLVSVVQGEEAVKVDRSRFPKEVMFGTMAGDKMMMDREGYRYDTAEQLIKATESDDISVRQTALRMLIQKVGEQGKPVLIKALDDPEVFVRLRAAELLGYLGDANGLPRLRKDFAEWTDKYEKGIEGGNKPPSGPRVMSRARYTLLEPLQIGRALAKFGDNSAFELAAKMATTSPGAPIRLDAVRVLIEISRNDRAALLRQKRDPYLIFLSMARTEKDLLVLWDLAGVAVHMPAELRTQVFDTLLSSPGVPEKIREDVRNYRQAIQRRSQVQP